MDTTYTVKWETEAAPNAGIKKDDLPKGLENIGKQREWLKSSEEGRAVFQSLKSSGFDITDVQDEPVYRVKDKGKIKFWVPYGQWYQSYHPVGQKTHYALVRVEKAAPTADEIAANLEEHKAQQQAELEQHRSEQQAELEKMKAELQLQKEKLQGDLELAKIRQDMENLKRGAMGATPTPGAVPGAPAGLRTFEIYGVVNGQPVPLSQVAVNQGGRYVQLPGSRIVIGDVPSDGFGLAGIPGAWASVYAGQSPANFGLDADKGVLGHDGTRAWVLPASFLTQLFGANWRQQVYG